MTSDVLINNEQSSVYSPKALRQLVTSSRVLTCITMDQHQEKPLIDERELFPILAQAAET